MKWSHIQQNSIKRSKQDNTPFPCLYCPQIKLHLIEGAHVYQHMYQMIFT